MKYLYLIFISMMFLQCDDTVEDVEIFGMSPEYIMLEEGQILSKEPKPYEDLSNFIVYGDYLLLVDRGNGVHVVDNQNPNMPIDISFIEMPGTIGVVAIQDNLVISLANYLITVDISDYTNAYIINIFEIENSAQGFGLYPLDYNGYFECAMPEKGIVYDWVRKSLTNPKCHTN